MLVSQLIFYQVLTNLAGHAQMTMAIPTQKLPRLKNAKPGKLWFLPFHADPMAAMAMAIVLFIFHNNNIQTLRVPIDMAGPN
mmetsp:Transcript_21114/g.33149  ORF Transcript_21114/g.33149 Transcript_21114/m.33149 type:complete len:82 (+) Transcript_21114:1723-1968(+)